MKQLAIALWVIAGSVAAGGASFAAGAPEKLFRLGMTQEEMHAAFGEPQSYLNLRTQQHITRDEFLASGGACRCRPLYSRKTANNEYEIVIFEATDDSKSRLHPAVRVQSVRFRLDRDMSPEEALADIAEAKALCAGQCIVQRGRFGDATATRPEIDVQFAFIFSENDPRKVAQVEMDAKK